MLVAPNLIDRIYEASVRVERWPDLLQDIADKAGAKCCVFLTRSPAHVDWVISVDAQDAMADYVAEGWVDDQSFVAPLFAEQWPGFRTETDYRSVDEIATLPVHREFLGPRGLSPGMGTVIQGAGDAAIQIALQGFVSHAAARRAVAAMDVLRPHLARAITVTALLRDRTQIVVDSLALGGIAAAVLGAGGKLRSANAAFVEKMGDRMIDGPGPLRFTDPFVMAQVADALCGDDGRQGRVRSIAVIGDHPAASFAMHLLPITGAARDVCDSDGVLLVVGDPSNRSIPSADLLRLLFDLTPGEARVARRIAEGGTVASTAAFLAISEATVRVHLKAIFAKTGCMRQSDIIRLLTGLGAPGA